MVVFRDLLLIIWIRKLLMQVIEVGKNYGNLYK